MDKNNKIDKSFHRAVKTSYSLSRDEIQKGGIRDTAFNTTISYYDNIFHKVDPIDVLVS